MRVKSMDPFIYRAYPEGQERFPVVLNQENKALPDNSGDTVSEIKKFISRMKKDDYILIGIVAVLFFEGSDDYVLMAVLGYLFIMGIL